MKRRSRDNKGGGLPEAVGFRIEPAVARKLEEACRGKVRKSQVLRAAIENFLAKPAAERDAIITRSIVGEGRS